RIIVRVFLFGEQRTIPAQEFHNLLVGIKYIFACPLRHSTILGKLAVVIHRREDRKTVLLSGDIVILTMPWRDVNLSGSCFHGDEIGANDFGRTREKGMLGFQSRQLLSCKSANGLDKSQAGFLEEGFNQSA